jgi:phage tail sheath protein FI
MPVGVQVTTETAPGGGGLQANESAAYFVAGLTERGSVTEPVVLRSMGEYRRLLGERVAYGSLYDDLAAFFAEGGARAYVARAVGAAASVGTLTLQDRAGVPLNTLRIDAKDPGAWSANVTVQVADGLVADTFTLTLRYKGEQVERYENLASPAAAVQALAVSGYVRAVDLGSATAPPANNPAVLAATALSAGSDDRAAVTSAELVVALERFGVELGSGAVAIPGHPHSTVAAGLTAHASARRRIALVAPSVGTEVAAAGAAARGLRTSAGAEHVGFFYPWVKVPDGAGGSRTISPEGYVAGVRARTIAQVGTWRAPAGEIAASRHLVGVERELTRDQIDTLADDAVSAIRPMLSGFRLYGWRSLSLDEVHYRFLSTRDLLNELASKSERALERLVFETIDGRGQLFVKAETEVERIVEPIRAGGGLYEKVGDGQVIDPGYSIDTGPGVNTPETIARGEVNVALSVRPSPVGELIRMVITAVGVNADL